MFEVLFIFILGLIIGSFLNCAAYRMHKGESFVLGRSYCPNCKHELQSKDLIPLLSFLFLKGKCRYCKKSISIQYPLVEILTAIFFSFIFIQIGLTWQLLFWLILASLIIVIFIYDIKYYIIPDGAIFSAIALTFLMLLVSYFLGSFSLESLLTSLASALGLSLFFFAIWFFSKGMAMGFGDVKLAFFIGLILGWPNVIVGTFLGFLFGAIIGIVMILIKGKSLKSELPFAPFLILGMLTTFFWGNIIINWYISLLK